MDDRELLELYREEGREREAFNLIVDKYSERLYWLIRRMVPSHDDSNDILQNSLIKAWRGLPNFKGDSALYTWLYRVTTNETLTFLNRERRRNLLSLSDSAQTVERQLQADPYFNGDKAEKLLRKAILLLPPRQRTVFTLRYYSEMSYREMAEVLETSEGALKASYHHAYNKVKTFLKESI